MSGNQDEDMADFVGAPAAGTWDERLADFRSSSSGPRAYDCPVHGPAWEYLDPRAGPCVYCEKDGPPVIGEADARQGAEKDPDQRTE